jgi:hypothetical protein
MQKEILKKNQGLDSPSLAASLWVEKLLRPLTRKTIMRIIELGKDEGGQG